MSDLTDSSLCMSAFASEAADVASAPSKPALSGLLSTGPGGFVARMSSTERAICLLARLTRSPRLCLEAMLLRPSDERSLMGVELLGREPSGCQDRAGGMSCQDCRPLSLLSFQPSSDVLAGCAAVVKGGADAAKMEGGMLIPDIQSSARYRLQRHLAEKDSSLLVNFSSAHMSARQVARSILNNHLRLFYFASMIPLLMSVPLRCQVRHPCTCVTSALKGRRLRADFPKILTSCLLDDSASMQRRALRVMYRNAPQMCLC